jgi:hypothetical protein
MKGRILYLLLSIIALSAQAQTKDGKEILAAAKPQEINIQEDTTHHYWKKGAFLGVTLGQTALFNWAGGGQNTILGQISANGFINYQRGHMEWDNSINFLLGGIVQGHVLGTQGYRKAAFRKNVDNLQVTSRLGYILDKKKQWMAAFLVDYKTSVLNGYDYTAYDASASLTNPQRISSPFSPSFVVLSLGINYKPAPYVSFYLSPLAGKLSFINGKASDSASNKSNDITSNPQYYNRVDGSRYGFNYGQTFRGQLGAYFRADFQKDLMKNINLKTTLELFTPYTNEIIDNGGDSVLLRRGITTINTVGKIDVNWLTSINFKVNKYITCSFEMQLLYSYTTLVPRYDYSTGIIDKRYNSIQFREGLTLGFGYKFAEKAADKLKK